MVKFCFVMSGVNAEYIETNANYIQLVNYRFCHFVSDKHKRSLEEVFLMKLFSYVLDYNYKTFHVNPG